MVSQGAQDLQPVLDAEQERRIDKVDLLLRMEHDRFQAFYEAFEDTIASLESECKINIPFAHRSLTGDDDRGRRLYSLETWGAGADVLARNLPEEWRQYVSRLDYRLEVDIQERKLSKLLAHIEEHGKGKRNVSYFNTRPRQKSEGRHAGGKGVAMGSHKSQTRLVTYKRTGENGAIEIQVTGEAIDNTIATAKELLQKGAFSSWYDAVVAVLQGRLAVSSRQAGFTDVEQLILFLSPGDLPEEKGTVSANDMKQVRELLGSLGAADRKLLIQKLGIKLKDLM